MANKLSYGASNTQQLIKSDRSMLTLSDDSAMMKQILTTHAPDGREVDTKPLLLIVEDILQRASLQLDVTMMHTTTLSNEEDKTQQAGFIAILSAVSHTIDQISCEIVYKAFGGADAHNTTLSLFNMLSSYSWEAKMVLTLAAFALTYGEFWLLAQIYSSNQLAKSIAILRQLPTVLEQSGSLKPRFDAINKLIKAMLDVSQCVVELKELPSSYIARDESSFSSAVAHVPTAVYWTIRSVVACVTQISSLTSFGYEYVAATTESWELSTLTHKLNTIYDHLKKQLIECHKFIEEKRENETYKNLIELFKTSHIDNMRILKALIYAKDDQQPLHDGATKRKVNLEVLRRKNVLLLISGLDISRDELSILEQIYNESRIHATRLESHYEVVWIPVVDRSISWADQMKKQFESLQETMPWYSVSHPSLIDKAVIRFIKEEWHFRTKPILVVLDPQGRVACPNAIHMMWIWGSNAFPFTSMREEALWREETWKLELLINGIDPLILTWIREGKYIFLYGGEDIEWIRKFTTTAKSVAKSSNIALEMIYVGKSSKREQVRRNIAAITLENLSHCWSDLTMVWFFWTRLESMLLSKLQLGRADDDSDTMTREIKKLLSYDKSGSWAVLSKGSAVVVNGHGTTVGQTLSEYDNWKVNVPVKGYDVAFDEYHKKIHGVAPSCCRFEFPSTAGRIPVNMKCPECVRVMEKFVTFMCCHDENATAALD